MGLSSSLNAGVSGLAANATKLATISDNIANSATFGYKRANTEFSSLVLQQGAGKFSAGGVRVATFKDVSAQGALISTSNSTDISVSGRGLLPVTNLAGATSTTGERPLFFTSTGSFAPDKNGLLRTLNGNFLMGWPADPDGTVNVPTRTSAAGLEPVQVTANQFIAVPTTKIELGLNIPATETESGASGNAIDLPIEYFDTLGSSQTLNLSFIPQVPATGSTNTWTLDITDFATDPNNPIATLDITFDDTLGFGGSILSVTPGAGAAYDSTTGLITISTSSGTLDIDIGVPGGGGPLTQLSSNFSPVGVRADGAPVGNLNALEITEDGRIEGIYDNGFRRTIYQIPLADVPNINGLQAFDNQTFGVSQASGDFFLWDANTGPVGTTIGFALAESTTDIAGELTDLIKTQRAYSSNAKIIQTVDEMLQETTNLIR